MTGSSATELPLGRNAADFGLALDPASIQRLEAAHGLVVG